MVTEKRLIDSEHLRRYALYEYMRAKMKHKDDYNFEHWAGIVVAMIEELLRGMPTVDAVEVVRCKDCKHWHKNGSGCGWCEAWEGGRFHDNFCNYGERKENG